MPRVAIVVAGATATGKTGIGEALARSLGGEVVCADARQVYRELEIGTGKPTPADRARLPHHLFDWRGLGEPASAGAWARAAAAACEGVFARGRVPVLVGGSGLYLSALMRGLHEEPPRDPERRARLLAELGERGPEALHARLAALDPATAARLAPRDRQRIVRALELVEAASAPLDAWRNERRESPLAAEFRALELTCPARALAGRIERRTRAMFDQGLADETRALADAGLRPALEALSAIGYDEALALMDGTLDRAQAEARTNLRTRQLAKRQRTWFRHQLEATRIETEPWDEAAILRRARAVAEQAPV